MNGFREGGGESSDAGRMPENDVDFDAELQHMLACGQELIDAFEGTNKPFSAVSERVSIEMLSCIIPRFSSASLSKTTRARASSNDIQSGLTVLVGCVVCKKAPRRGLRIGLMTHSKSFKLSCYSFAKPSKAPRCTCLYP